MVKKCKISALHPKVQGKPGPLGFDQESLPRGGDLTAFKSLTVGCPVEMVTLGID